MNETKQVTSPSLFSEDSPEETVKELAKEVSQLMVDHDMLEADSVESQADEMGNWPSSKLEDLKSKIMDKKVSSRKISDIADKRHTDDEEWRAEDLVKDFGHNFIKLSCGDEILEAVLANESIEKLEEMAAWAHKDLLKAKRKAFLLDKAVEKAHRLLEQRALEFIEKQL